MEASLSLDCRLSALGLSLSPGKSSILLGNEVTPATIEDNFGPQLLSSLGASISLISSTGHVVLGSPIGSSDYITTFAERAIDEARRILGLISSLLLDWDSTGAPDTGIFSPDEHNCLMRYTVRILTHGWPSTLLLLVYNPTPTEPAYPPTTPSPPSSIHSWMVRTCLLLMQRILPNPPPTIYCSLSTRPASFLHPSSTSNLHPKYRLLSPPLSPPSPFWMSINPRLTRARRDSLVAPPNMVRLRGMSECPKLAASVILSKELTRSQLGRLIYSLALHISLIKTAYRALSNQVLTVYPSVLTRVTMYIAVKDFVFMGPSATRSVMSYASSSSAAGFA